jgi:hypothetical protein
MKGPAGDPIIAYDKQAVKQKIKEDMKTEKQTLKQVLQQEFNHQQQEQNVIKDWKAPEEYEYMQFADSSDEEPK